MDCGTNVVEHVESQNVILNFFKDNCYLVFVLLAIRTKSAKTKVCQNFFFNTFT